jgi:hypothetical protein
MLCLNALFECHLNEMQAHGPISHQMNPFPTKCTTLPFALWPDMHMDYFPSHACVSSCCTQSRSLRCQIVCSSASFRRPCRRPCLRRGTPPCCAFAASLSPQTFTPGRRRALIRSARGSSARPLSAQSPNVWSPSQRRRRLTWRPPCGSASPPQSPRPGPRLTSWPPFASPSSAGPTSQLGAPLESQRWTQWPVHSGRSPCGCAASSRGTPNTCRALTPPWQEPWQRPSDGHTPPSCGRSSLASMSLARYQTPACSGLSAGRLPCLPLPSHLTPTLHTLTDSLHRWPATTPAPHPHNFASLSRSPSPRRKSSTLALSVARTPAPRWTPDSATEAGDHHAVSV